MNKDHWMTRWAVPLTALTAIITLIVSVADLIASKQGYDRLGLIDATIQDTEDLRAALRKPLEGVWSYKMSYSKFKEKEGTWQADGNAIFIWRPSGDKGKYDVYISASLVEIGTSANQLITWHLEADLAANQQGWPTEPFELKCEYKGRTASDPKWNSPGSPYATIKSLAITDKSDREALKITGTYSTTTTEGVLTLSRED